MQLVGSKPAQRNNCPDWLGYSSLWSHSYSPGPGQVVGSSVGTHCTMPAAYLGFPTHWLRLLVRLACESKLFVTLWFSPDQPQFGVDIYCHNMSRLHWVWLNILGGDSFFFFLPHILFICFLEEFILWKQSSVVLVYHVSWRIQPSSKRHKWTGPCPTHAALGDPLQIWGPITLHVIPESALSSVGVNC